MTFNAVFGVWCWEYEPWGSGSSTADFSRATTRLIGLQDSAPGEVDAVWSELGHAAIYYDPGSSGLPRCHDFHRSSRFPPLEHGEYWLFTQTCRALAFADRQLPRLVVWARFFDEQRKRGSSSPVRLRQQFAEPGAQRRSFSSAPNPSSRLAH
jgi:hypothetical protein